MNQASPVSCPPPPNPGPPTRWQPPSPGEPAEQQGTTARKGSRGAEEENVAALPVGQTSPLDSSFFKITAI